MNDPVVDNGFLVLGITDGVSESWSSENEVDDPTLSIAAIMYSFLGS